MKKHNSILALAVLALATFSVQANAARKTVTTTTYENDSPVRSSQAASASSTSNSGMRFGLGYAPSSILANGFDAFSFMLDLSAHDSLEVLYGFPAAGTGVTVQMAGGLAYRRTVVGSHDLGMHIGLGFSLGNNAAAAFSTDIAGVLGARYEIANHLVVTAEYGPALTISAPAGGTAVNFGFRPMTSFGGLAFHYLF